MGKTRTPNFQIYSRIFKKWVVLIWNVLSDKNCTDMDNTRFTFNLTRDDSRHKDLHT